MVRCAGIAVAALLLAVNGSTQDPPRFSPLAVPGIEGAEVRSAVLDRFGALWLGTERGVHRFDGSRTEHYLNDPLDSLSLSDDVVYNLYVGPDEAIWAATFLGVWRIDPRTGERRRIPLVPHHRRSGYYYECLGLAWADDGTLWAFCNRSGLARMRPGEQVLTVLDLPRSYAVKGGCLDGEGMLWFTNRDTLVRYDPLSGALERHPFRLNGRSAPPKTLLLRVLADRYEPNALWCTTWGLGFVRFNTATGAFDRQLVLREPITDLQNIVLSAVQRDRGSWWVQIDEGLAIADARTGKVRLLSDEDAWDGRRTTGISELGDGTLLIGSPGSIHLLSPDRVKLLPITQNAGYQNTHITPAIDGDGYWIVRYYADRELIRVDGQGRVTARIPLPQEERPYEVFKTLQTADGSVWLAATTGLMHHAPGEPGVKRIPPERMGLKGGYFYAMQLHEAPDGALWLAAGHEGLVRWDSAAGRGERFLAPVTGDGAPGHVLSVQRYSDGQLLLSLGGDGPALFSLSRRTITPLAGPTLPRELFRASTDVFADRAGRIHVLTRSHGLMRLVRGPDGNWRLDRRWLPTDRPWLEHAALDQEGRAWIKTRTGLMLFDPGSDVLHRLDALHGFVSTPIYAVAEGRDGEMLLSTGRWNRVLPGFEPVRQEPRLMLRSATAGGQPIGIDELLAGSTRMAATTNDLQLTFGTVALLEGDAFTYAYRIARDGQQGEWADLGRERSFSLLDLRPGAYQVELRAESPSARPVSLVLGFEVLPPWWATWWARLAFIACAVIAVVLITRRILQVRFRRVMREVEREREVERVRLRIARDIHDGIGSGLTRINMLARQLGDSAGPQAERITEASAELVKELGEIVWTVDPRNDNYGSFLAYVRSILGRQAEQLPMALTSDLRCAEEDSARIIGPEVKRNVLLVLKEAVNNAVKHSGGKRIEVSLALAPDMVRLMVKDDGAGFDPDKVREGANGLVNFRKRAEALQGRFSLQTGPGGTTITLEAPIPP